MSFHVQRMRHALCVCYSIVLIFTITFDFVNGSLDSYIRRTRDSKDSVRLERQKRTAARLEGDLPRNFNIKAYTSSTSEIQNTDLSALVKALEKSSDDTIQNPPSKKDTVQTYEPFFSGSSRGQTRLGILRRYGRQNSGSLQEFKSAYTDFYPDLVSFTQDLAKNLVGSAPKVLQNVMAILNLLKPEDIDPNSQDTKTVMKKYLYIQLSYDLVAKYGGPYVQDDKKGWFQSQIQNLTYQIGHTMDALAAQMIFVTDSSDVSFLSAGASGPNTGVRSLGVSYEDSCKLAELQFFFQQGTERTMC